MRNAFMHAWSTPASARMQRHLNNETAVEADAPEEVLDATEAHMPAGTAPRMPVAAAR